MGVADMVLLRAGPVDAGLIDSAAVMACVLDLLGSGPSNRALPSIFDGFARAGLAQEVASWISTAANLPITAPQIARALGPDAITALAAAAGVPASIVPGILCVVLPAVIDQLTPTGAMPQARHREPQLARGKAVAIA